MKDKITAILERELSKLDVMSRLNPEPLGSRDIKSLDTLIKAFHSFVSPKADSDSTSESAPASQATESLLNDILSESINK